MSLDSPLRPLPTKMLAPEHAPALSSSSAPPPPMPTNMNTTNMAANAVPSASYTTSAPTPLSSTSSTSLNGSSVSLASARSRSPEQDVADGAAQDHDAGAHSDVDPQIIEALKSKDRIYVLKLGEQMETLINDRRSRIELTPATSYQRLLVHRCAGYYGLQPEAGQSTKTSITVVPTPESRIPARRLSDLVPEAPAQGPAFQIMRRTAQDRSRSKPHSHTGSVAGEDPDLSDVEPSESGSLGGRSNATGGSRKRRTMEEREAAYNEARSRIFMNFEEKEKSKEKDMSASSSSLSLVSGSASTSGRGEGSSMGDLDDAVSSPATESEWSGPVARQGKDLRRHGSGNNSSSQRSLRSTAPPFNATSTSNARGSRSASPSSFQYPTLYDPATANAVQYDPAHAQAQPIPGNQVFMGPYMYSYPPAGQTSPPHQGYLQPYPYSYPPYPPYMPPPQPPHPNSDPVSPSEAYQQPQPHAQHPPQMQPMPYNPYVWPHAHAPPPPGPLQQPQQPSHNVTPPVQGVSPQYPPPQFVPSYPGYPMQPQPGYYAPPPQPGHQAPPHPQSLPMPSLQPFPTEPPRQLSNGSRNGTMDHSRPRNSSSSSAGSSKRGGPPSATRAPWSYGPGASSNGFPTSNGFGNEIVVGPRLSAASRRTSGASSSGSGSTGNRTPGDETSSIASSSTTSSSSRRTYTSTTSSQQHPLPPRPDWAVGLKPQPTLHGSHTHNRHHDGALSGNNSRNMSPARNGGVSTAQQMQPVSLGSTDFPPLAGGSSRAPGPVVAGAWGNSSSTRSILMPNPGHPSAPVRPANANASAGANSRLDEGDRNFERPAPKGEKELYNPQAPTKGAKSPAKGEKEKERERGEAVANAILADRVSALALENGEDAAHAPKAPAVSSS